MTRIRTVILLLTTVMGVACGVGPAAAEWNFDLYGGAAKLNLSDFGVRGSDERGASVNIPALHVDTDWGFTVGVRGGYWLDPLPFLGFDLDVFYVQAPVPSQITKAATTVAGFVGEFLDRRITVSPDGVAVIPHTNLPLFGFAPEIRLRWPLLVDQTFPHGRLQPYITAGPSWAFSLKNDHVVLELGGKLGIGLAFQIAPAVALFTEYRYVFYPGFEFTDKNLTYKTDINSHSAIVGLSLRF
jgi:opacity protein-like surface antigen